MSRTVLTNKRIFLPVCDSELSKRRAVSLLYLSYLFLLNFGHWIIQPYEFEVKTNLVFKSSTYIQLLNE